MFHNMQHFQGAVALTQVPQQLCAVPEVFLHSRLVLVINHLFCLFFQTVPDPFETGTVQVLPERCEGTGNHDTGGSQGTQGARNVDLYLSKYWAAYD